LKKALLTPLILSTALTGPVIAQETPASTAQPANSPVNARFEFGNRQYKGQFSLRYWYGNNSIDQWLKSKDSSSGIDIFNNTKLSLGMLNVNTDYWFGIVTPEGLGFLGTVFGLGLSVDYMDQLVQDVRLMTYMMDFQFAKVSLWHDQDWKNNIVLSGHYISYFNMIYNNLPPLPFQAAPYFGAGIGLEGKHPISELGEISYKLVYVPNSRTPNPLPDGMGLLSEINTRWFLNPNLAFNLGYRFNFFRSSGDGSATSASTGSEVKLTRTLEDMFHGVNIGFTNYF